jgi:hypothetical protein
MKIAMKIAIRALAALLLATTFAAPPAYANDLSSLTPGAVLPGNRLSIALRSYALPPGEWILAARHVRTVRLNEIAQGAEVVEAAFARVIDGRVRAVLVFIGPTAMTRTRTWREDSGCKPRTNVLFLDNGGSVTHPECIGVQWFNAIPPRVEGAEVFAAASALFTARALTTPSPVLRIGAIRYQGEEYLRISAFVDPELFGLGAEQTRALTAAPPAVELWARALRATLATALDGAAGTFRLPPLP